MKAVENIFGLDLFPGVVINEIETIPQLDIILSMLKVSMSEAKLIALVAIVLVQQGNALVTVMCGY